MINFETFMFVSIVLVLFCAGWFLGYISDCIQEKQKKNWLQEKQKKNWLQKKLICEQVLFFAGGLLPNEKIIVSREDFKKIVESKYIDGDSIWCWDRRYVIEGHQLEQETINNFVRVELGETRTNRNFELKNV